MKALNNISQVFLAVFFGLSVSLQGIQPAAAKKSDLPALSLPTISLLSPASALAGSGPLTITITGTSFQSDSVARWNGTDIVPTIFVGASQVQALLPASALDHGRILKISVSNPASGGGISNTLDFTVNNPVPVLNDLSPAKKTAGDGNFDVILDGANFNSGSVALWNGSQLTTTFVTATQLSASVPSSFILNEGTADIAVSNPAPGGGTSSALTFTVTARTDTWMAHSPEGGMVNDFQLDPQNPSVLYADTDVAGIYKSVDGGQSWFAINNGIDFLGSSKVVVDPANSSILVAAVVGAVGGSTYMSKNGGAFWTKVLPDAGCIKFYPNNPSTIFVGAGRGIYRTLDGGKTWKNIGDPGGYPMNRIVLDPQDAQTVYAFSNPSEGMVVSLWKTTDGGATWNTLSLPGSSASILMSLEIDPANSRVLYAGTEYAQGSPDSGLYKTEDAGTTWIKVIPEAAYYSKIAFSRSNPNDVYVSTSGGVNNGGVYKSSDGGQNWQWVGSGGDFEDLGADPANPLVLYEAGVDGMSKSLDAGVTWSPINKGLYAHQINDLVYSSQTTTLFATTWNGGIWKSTNYGSSWSRIALDQPYYLSFVSMDPIDQQHLFTGSGSAVSGSAVEETPDGGQTWSTRSWAPIPNAITFASNSDLYYGASEWVVYKSTDDGNTWAAANGLPSCSVKYCWVGFLTSDPVDPNVIYAGLTSEREDPELGAVRTIDLYKTVDGGDSWNLIHTGPFEWYYDAFAVDPVETSTLYLSDDDGVFKSTDGGANWLEADGGLSGIRVPVIAVDPINDQIVYAGTEDHGVYRSQDGGATWAGFNYGMTSGTVLAVIAIPDIPVAQVSSFLGPRAAGQGGQVSGLYSIAGGQVYAYFGTGTPATVPTLSAPADTEQLFTRRPNFDWSDVNGATKYNIQLSRNNTFTSLVANATVLSSSYTPTADLLASTTFNWRVRAMAGGAYGGWSVVRSFTTANPPSIPVLGAPASNALLRDLTPVLDWSNSIMPISGAYGFGHYQVQLSTDAGFGSIALNDVTLTGDITGSSYTPLSDLLHNTKYYWRVRAYNTHGEYSAWSVSRYFRTVMAAPTLMLPANTATPPVVLLRPVFDWANVAGVTKYTLQVSASSTFSKPVVKVNVVPSTYTPTKDLPGRTTLYWRVQALGPNGPSDWSDVWQFATP